MTTRMLVSVRSVAEALLAAAGGADFIDLKEPRDGALGGLPLATISTVVSALRERGIALPISATIGDMRMDDLPAIMAQVNAVAACGVDYVKVGIERAAGAPAVIDALAASRHQIVPVFIADDGLGANHVAQACAAGFPGVMVDTAAKLAGSVFDVMSIDALQAFIATVRAAGALVGLAGALRVNDVPQVLRLAPDFAGFRSAVCAGSRSGELDPLRLRTLADAMHAGDRLAA